MQTVAVLEQKALAGELVDPNEYAEAKAAAKAARELSEIQNRGEKERFALKMQQVAQEELDGVESDLRHFLDTDPREAIVRRIAELTEEYATATKSGLAAMDSLRHRYFAVVKAYPDFKPNADVGNGEFRIGETWAGSILNGVGPKEKGIRDTLKEVAAKLAPKQTSGGVRRF